MDRFPEEKQASLPDLEQSILAFWDETDVFARSLDRPADAPTFTFYEGPPTANGKPGIHHVMSRTIKDTFCRYKTMKGYLVDRKGGWDSHGLPVEIEVEKELGLSGREQVQAYGIERYNAACKSSVLRYKDMWDDLTVRMGYWVDLDHPYITFNNNYIESVWWLLKQIYDKGLLYKGYKIQWYSPGSGTVLSSHEVSLGYSDVQDPSVFVRFPVRGEANSYFLAWTTTPWTLISNVALAVRPDIEYVQVIRGGEGGDERLILARDRLGVLEDDFAVERAVLGSDLVGTHYDPLYPYFVSDASAEEVWRVVPADYVSTEDGTGIVHIAPAFGVEDYETSLRENLPVFNPVAADGRFTDKATLVAGDWFKDADKKIVRNLKDRGLMYRHETCVHSYPHDWRKGTPLMSYPVEGWFIRTTAIKDRLIELNDTINWQPEGIGTGRFGEWLRNNVDWALSRRRFWGTPLPIWESDAPNSEYREIIGSVAELRERCGDQLTEDFDLHRPFVDQLTWDAPDGGTMRRVEDLIDVWFDSGSMPFAQWHYPFENRREFERSFPADFIAEGVDQTRGWFYTLHAIAALVMDDVAFKNVVVNGLVLDEKGEKMSKTKGNAGDPFELIARHGADVVRWYMMSNSPPWENIRFSDHGLGETFRKFFSTLQNVYGFFAMYANIDGYVHAAERVRVSDRAELDRWILSRLNSTIQIVDREYDEYHPTRCARAIEEFVEALSNWYVRRSRRRFWKEADDDVDKQAAYQTMFECLDAVARLMAPLAPFFSEWLFQSLKRGSSVLSDLSVHTSSFPEVDIGSIDIELEVRMQLARTISSSVLGLRNASGVNVRQPLSRILVVTNETASEERVESVRGIILDEVNVKRVDYVDRTSGIVKRSARPNFKALGRRLGKLMKPVSELVRDLTELEIERYVSHGDLNVSVNGTEVELGAGDIEIVSEGIDGWLVLTEDGVTVALDPEVTLELRHEGLARETVNRIQNLRKQANFDVTDRIRVEFSASEALTASLMKFGDWIRNETLALELQEASNPGGDLVESFDIEDEALVVGIQRAADVQMS